MCAGWPELVCSLLWFPRALLQVVFHDVAVLTDKLFPVVEAMQKHFSAGSGTYYSDSIFFLSVAMHQIMPKGNLGCRGQQPLVLGVCLFPWLQYCGCPVSEELHQSTKEGEEASHTLCVTELPAQRIKGRALGGTAPGARSRGHSANGAV